MEIIFDLKIFILNFVIQIYFGWSAYWRLKCDEKNCGRLWNRRSSIA